MGPETLTSQLQEALQRQGVTCLLAFTLPGHRPQPTAQMTALATFRDEIDETSVTAGTGVQTSKPVKSVKSQKEDLSKKGPRTTTAKHRSEKVQTSNFLEKVLFHEDSFVVEICTATKAVNQKAKKLLMKELRTLIYGDKDYDEILSKNAKLQHDIENMKMAENELRNTNTNLLAKTAELKTTIKNMTEAEELRLKAAKQEILERMTRQAQILQKQFTAQSKVEIQEMEIAKHHLRLLTDFATAWEGCQIMLLENDAKVLFFGTDSECQRAKLELSKQIKQIADDSLSVTEPVGAILLTDKGDQYLKEILRLHPKCSLTLSESSIKCASFNHAGLEQLMASLKAALVRKTCEVPHSIIQDAQFKVLKGTLEEKYLVKINADSDSDRVVIDGVAGDVEVASRKVEIFTSLNIPGRKEFCIPGALQGKACTKWFSDTLNDAKLMIGKNGQIIQEIKQDGYSLVFECRKETLELVLMKLNDIKYGIISTAVNLNKSFPQFHDRALLINGLHCHNKDTFCKTFLQRLKQEGISCILDIIVPKEQVLPEFGIALHGKRQQLELRSKDSHHYADEVKSCYVEQGPCKITITSGDISKSQTDAAVIFVGKDLEVNNTSVGRACNQVFPELQQELRNLKLPDHNNGGHVFHLYVSELVTRPLIMYAILQHFYQPEKEVERIVTEIIKQMENRKLASVAMTPLGVGTRFNFNHEEIANASVRGIKAARDVSSLKEIVIIINERQHADSFSSAISQMIAPVTFITTNDQCEDKTIEQIENEQVNITTTERFEALLCTQKGDGCEEIITQALLKELKTTFVWQETERDIDTFEQLDQKVKEKIIKFAKDNKILVTKSEMGLGMSGRKDLVQNLQSEIRKGMYDFVVEKSREGEKKRKELGLPVSTDRFPSYWKDCECKYETAVQRWNQAGTHTVPVSDEERKAVEQLFLTTWRQDADAAERDAVKVMKVERLENPILWRAYSSKRELLFNDLVARHTGTGPTRCTPVENISGSRGPVLTTKKIDKNGPLDRQIYHEINEHYFFHGTKRQIIQTICSQGLDFRVGNESGNLGKGVYGAECSEKSSQYVDIVTSDRKNEMEFVMFLMRMSLGEPYLNTQTRINLFRYNNRPPCMSCKETKCACPNSRLYNSVIHNPAGVKTFREFVVYDQDVCYPEYLITYRYSL